MGWQMFSASIASGYRDVRFQGGPIRCYSDSHATSGFIYFSGLPNTHHAVCFALPAPGRQLHGCRRHIGMYALLMSALVGAGGRVEAFDRTRDYASARKPGVEWS
jgi:hypothetical protein